jgi:hypothetical protein
MNPFYYWNGLNQLGMNFYAMFPPRSESTIDIS